MQISARPLPLSVQFGELELRVARYLKPAQVADVKRAFEFGAQAHHGQKRASGEAYIHHPLAVALILADMHMDHDTLVAALLHDVIEDTGTSKQTVGEKFGREVAEIVDGLSKLTHVGFESNLDKQAQNFQKMLLAMSNDIRVIVVKLADRLHNMRTLGALTPVKRRAVARETLEIYAPIAQRLGMNQIRLELEDLGFAAMHPMRHRILLHEVRRIRGHRKEIVSQIRTALKRRLRQEEIEADVIGREKHLYSIYEKMRTKTQSFSDVYDVYAFRILVENVDNCYRVLGTTHNLYKPVPDKFKDYIAIPKANGYQSLHTVLFGPYGVPIEVQIRTKEMDEVAEVGIAAHWLYKTSSKGAANRAQQRAREWLRGVMEIQQQAGNSEEFLEHIKTDLFPDEIYVFTPKGAILELPKGATAVDFAYSVHSQLGDACVGVRINRQLMPLRTVLNSGQTVEIITAEGAHPNPAWLSFVVTAKARAHIRHYLKNLQSDEAATMGKRLLNRELEAFALSVGKLDKAVVAQVVSEAKVKSFAQLLEDIGLGKRLAPIIARTLVVAAGLPQTSSTPASGSDGAQPLVIKGTEGMVVSFPKCCLPLPGDDILGYVTAGRGIVIHRQNCKNIAEFRNQPEKWIDVDWAADLAHEFQTEIKLEVTNQRGALATIAAAIADQGANIENIEMSDRDDRQVNLILLVSVRDRVHLAQVLRSIRLLKHITRVARHHS